MDCVFGCGRERRRDGDECRRCYKTMRQRAYRDSDEGRNRRFQEQQWDSYVELTDDVLDGLSYSRWMGRQFRE